MTGSPEAPLLSIRDLSIEFDAPHGTFSAVNELSLDIGRGETVALVGESGSGKSLTARAIMGLLDPSARVRSGSITFNDVDLLEIDEETHRSIRGREIGIVFQDVMNALHPLFTVGSQIAEAIRIHQPDLSRSEARSRAVDLLGRVRIPHADRRCDEYPMSLSGGMRQRVAIAMAIANRPQLLIADEPTTALDVTIEAQILDLLTELKTEFEMSVLLISHDLGVVREVADSVGVMYAGQLVEYAPKVRLFSEGPSHPYSEGLLRARPVIGSPEPLVAIPGAPPAPDHRPDGCPFHPRCGYAGAVCTTTPPEPQVLDDRRTVWCHFHGHVGRGAR